MDLHVGFVLLSLLVIVIGILGLIRILNYISKRFNIK